MSLAKIKKGSKVIMCMFTGCPVGVFEVESTDEKKIVVIKKNGEKAIFSRKSGKQLNVEEGKEKYANLIKEDDGSYVAPDRKGKKAVAPAQKKAPKKAEPVKEPEDEGIEDEEEEEDEPVEEKPAKKTNKKAAPPTKTAKGSKKKAPAEDEDDEYEEVE